MLYSTGQEESQATVKEMEARLETIRINATSVANELRSEKKKWNDEKVQLNKVIETLQNKTSNESKTNQNGNNNNISNNNSNTSSSSSSSATPSILSSITMDDVLLRKLTPTAATINVIKKGMSITDMYTSLIETDTKLRSAENENIRINTYMSQILSELTTKAPIIQQQKEDYERVVQSHDALASKLDEAYRLTHTLENNNELLNSKLQKSNVNYKEAKQTNNDLGIQVQNLVKKQLQNASRNTFMSNPIAGLAQSKMQSSSSTDPKRVIDENLVEFDDVPDLIRKNANLLQVVRRLSAEKDQAERNGGITAANDQELEQALAQIEKMRNQRQRQQVMVQAIVRQRDMYRNMVQSGEQMNGSFVDLPSSDLFTDEQKDMLRRMKKDGHGVLKAAPSKWKNDTLFMVAAIEQDSLALCHASDEIKNDKKIVMMAVKKSSG